MAEVGFIVDDSDARVAITSKQQALGPNSLSTFFRTRAVPWFVERASDRFEQEGDDAVGTWKPLAFPTQKIRKATGHGPRSPINVRSEELQDYVLDSRGEIRSTTFTAQVKWPDATPGGVLGTKVRTAQRGSKTSNTPARPIIAISHVDAEYVSTELMEWISAWGPHELEML